ncbi:MAG: SDR family oxidoreductase [Acidobacteria bacterium]|nr:SDR family oxidoreductase [Acidobacteriota bacterium]MBS1865681.1 SDR family oxidoreductase [Acidobacteriota bacterium]
MGAQKPVVLITGTSSGFGKLFVETFGRNGYSVFATMRGVSGKNAKSAENLRAFAIQNSLDIHVKEMEVTDEPSVNECVTKVVNQAGRLDVVINNAGFAYVDLMEAITIDQAKKIFDTNVFGVQRVMRAVLPQMHRQKSGLVMQISSGAGRVIFPSFGIYCASKFALEAITETYRYELAESGIDCLSIEPGAYKTDIFGKIDGGDDQSRLASYGSMKAVPGKLRDAVANAAADPQEVADLALEIARTPFGKRQLRYRIATGGLGVVEINKLTDQVQAQLLRAFGLAEITKLVSSSSASA